SLAIEMDADLFTQTPAAAWAGYAALGTYGDIKRAMDRDTHRPVARKAPERVTGGEGLLAPPRRLLGHGSMHDGEPPPARTVPPARPPPCSPKPPPPSWRCRWVTR